MGNEGLYSIGNGMRKNKLKKLQAISFAGHSWLGQSCEVTHKIQSGKETLQTLAFTSHTAFHGLTLVNQSRASREFFIFTELYQSHTHNPYIKSHKKYRKMIEQKYNQIWHRIKSNIKNVVVNHNFTNFNN